MVAPRVYPETNHFGDRISHAARVYHNGCAPRIITSGGKVPFVHNFEGSEAQTCADLLVELYGIDSAAIILEPESRNTRDHATTLLEVLGDLDLPYEITVVTSAVHMLRSVKVFEKEGFTVHPAPTDFRADTHFRWSPYHLFPSAQFLFLTTMVLHEYYGLLAYWLFGWI